MADSDSDFEKEKSILLPKNKMTSLETGQGRTSYGSDGEEPALESGARRRVRGTDDVMEEEGSQEETTPHTSPTPPSSSQPQQQQSGDEEETDTQCGLLYCGKKLLNLLPVIGEGEEEGTAEFEEELRFGAWQVIQLIIPVTICMAVVVFFQLTIGVNITGPVQQPFYLAAESSSNEGINLAIALGNAAIFVVIILVMTILLVVLFKYRCYRAISVWLITASGILLFVVSSIYFVEIMNARKLVIDWFTFIFLIWNFGVLGLMVIHWKGPLRLQQSYLILLSALVATTLIQHLPNWTTWTLLAAISIYDLFAVLCPKGPLRVLVETAKERGDVLFPSLIYSSTMMWLGMADVDDKKSGSMPKGRPNKKSTSSDEDSNVSLSSAEDSDENTDRIAAVRGLAHNNSPPPGSPTQANTPAAAGQGDGGGEEEEEQEERTGFKLGLGDFIFYSVLVGKAAEVSEGDWVIISSCFVAILMGLCITSLILGIVRRALPALPISIFIGLVFYFTSQHLISPFVEVLNTHQVFI